MAKNNIYLGTLSGKLGDNVWWRTHGQQRVRTYFKRTDVAVGYETAERQSRFANLKSIYQWLPEDFKKACNLYKVGGNPYADFMRQYNDYGMGRDKQGFGAGRFLPVECSISNGTFNISPATGFKMVNQYVGEGTLPVVPGLVMPMQSGMEGVGTFGDYCDSLLQTYPQLREGDYLHILLSAVNYNETEWGEAYAVAGFPFAYSNMRHYRFKIDRSSTINFQNDFSYGLMLCGGYFGESDEKYYGGFCFNWEQIPVGDYGYYALVGAIMFERPTNTRQQRYSPAKLKFNRSQLEILNSQMRSRWNDYAAQSYVRVL